MKGLCRYIVSFSNKTFSPYSAISIRKGFENFLLESVQICLPHQSYFVLVLNLLCCRCLFLLFKFICLWGRKIIICFAVFSKYCQIATFYSTLYLISWFLGRELPPVPALFILTFNVMYEVSCVLLSRKRKFENTVEPRFTALLGEKFKDYVKRSVCCFEYFSWFAWFYWFRNQSAL